MKVAIAGAGAMGARFATMFFNASVDITMIDKWEEHVSQINDAGLDVENSKEQHASYKIPIYLPENVKEHFDLIIVFTKAMQMKGMLQEIQSVIDGNTYILTLSNGLGNIETIEQFVSRDHVIAGVTLWSSELLGPGKIKVTGSGSISLQAADKNVDIEKLEQIVALLNQAHLNAELTDDVLATIWRKAAFNCVINPLSSILDCNVEQFGGISTNFDMAELILNEIDKVARAEEIKFDSAEIKDILKAQFDPSASGEHYPSMYQDLKKGRKTEVDFLNGYIAKLGVKHEIMTPINRMITDMIHAKEEL